MSIFICWHGQQMKMLMVIPTTVYYIILVHLMDFLHRPAVISTKIISLNPDFLILTNSFNSKMRSRTLDICIIISPVSVIMFPTLKV